MARISVKLFLVTEVCFPGRLRVLIYDSCLLLLGKVLNSLLPPNDIKAVTSGVSREI